MKPKKLTLSAWGPYAGCQQVDFEDIPGGLFLLTGPTGSGKTMIFDGISYALFGALSGKVRERDTLRSDFAGESDETYVTLVFEHKGCEYTVTRYPKCTRKKKRGAGEITVNEKACLYMPDSTVIENLTAVNERIVSILGVTHEQFKQIAMIAQGEFQELLIADSKKRVEIFRNIFGTETYEQISYILTERARTLYSEISTLKSRTDEAAASIISDGHEDLASLIGQQVQNDVQIYEALQRAVAEDKKALTHADAQLKALESAYGSVLADYKLYEEYMQTAKKERQAAQTLRQSLQANEARIAELQKDYDSLAQREGELRLLSKKLDDIHRLLDLFKEVKLQEEAVKKAALAADADEKALHKKKAALDTAKQNFDRNKTALADSTAVSEDVVRIQAQMTENSRRKAECEALIGQCKEFVNVKRKYAKIAPVYEQSQQLSDELKKRYEAAELKRRQAAAGLLAQTLKADSPCPVCGSIHHPSPAKPVTDICSEAELKKLKNESETAAKKAGDLLNELTGLHKEKAVYWQSISRQAKTVLVLDTDRTLVASDGIFASEKLFYEAVQSEKTALLAIDSELKGRLEDLQKQKAYFDNLNKKQQQLETDIAAYTSAYEAAAALNESSQLEAKKQQALLENIKSRIQEDAQYALVVKEKSSLEEKIAEMDASIKNIRSEYSAAGLKRAADRGQLKKSEEVAGKHEMQAAGILKRLSENTGGEAAGLWLINREAEIETKRASRDSLYHRFHQNESICSVLKNKNGQKQRLEEAYGVIKSLENAARGNNSRRLEFEQYVLGTYFDEILAAANLRLEHMSEGRYELFRCEKVKDMRKRSSLDIEVLDNYTGRRRPVKTLSGGETFKAALSLALGLSDVIQSYVGGIDIDLLFIDEGFGSLDEMSVQTAVDALVDLAGGSRMVGIISHVAELKERIDTQLMIQKGVCGSTIRRGDR